MDVTDERWREVHVALQGIAQRRAALDAEEAHWLREAEAHQIWRPLGMTNVIDYMERVLGYAPRTAKERLRVAHALGTLPVLTAALEQGALQFSAVRELSRIATPDTEAAWTKAACGKNLREIETLVAGHRPGDLPDDPTDPDVRMHVVRFELSPETFAVLRQARSILDSEHHTNLTDDEFVTVLANTILDGEASFPTDHANPAGADDEMIESGTVDEGAGHATPLAVPESLARDDARAKGPTERADVGRAKFQVAVTLCRGCKQGWQLGGGVTVPIAPAAVERALCDAQHIGDLDADAPQRAHQDVSPAVLTLVDSLGSVLVDVTNKPAAKALVAPAITAVRITIYQGKHHSASVVAVLDGDPPLGAVALVAYDKDGKRVRSFGPVVANAKQIVIYEASDCAPAVDGTVATGADDDIRLAWLDRAGTLSAQTAPLHVQRDN